jgi:4-hydroxy-tetrahydrodipicolinate reductase
MAEVSRTPLRVAVCGLGSIGAHCAHLLLDQRRGFELVAAATLEPEARGRPVAEVVGAAAATSVAVVGSIDELLEAQPDAVVLATGSFLRDTAADVLKAVRAGANLVSPCEELAFPFNRFASHAREIDAAAHEHGVTVLGTGVNPGFIFDALLATVTGVCWDVRSIRGRRVVDVAGFGENIHRRLGIGYTPEEFEQGHRNGTIAGHVGFPESIEMVCERLGLPLDGPVEEVFEPMIAVTAAPTRYGQVPAGKTEGFVQRAVGTVGGELRVQLELVLHLRPAASALEPADTIAVDGRHPVRLELKPGMDAILATSAVLVNSIPGVVAAPPGLKSVKDLPAATAWLGEPVGVLR